MIIKDTSGLRIGTIDILRAITMFLMIFVNDLWSLTGVPEWLEHASAGEDRLGFSDIIFPLFLFIVGLSIPLAIENRSKKGESFYEMIGHIAARTIALLVMGFYMVNFETINEEATGINKYLWEILMATAIVLIWMDYKRLQLTQKGLGRALQVLGLIILAYLAWIYRGGPSDNISLMRPQWWGILGLIGWAYLLNSLLYLIFRKRIYYVVIAFLILLFMNVQERGFFEFLPGFRLVIGASNHVLVTGGMLCTIIFLKFREKGKVNQFLGYAAMAGGLFILYGFLLRLEFPISKLSGSPSWVAICMGIGLLSYALLYILVDQHGYDKWANILKPAGTSTLTCYLMPYFAYPIITLIGVSLPDFLTDGIIGIMKSLLFSLLIILFVGMLEKRNIRLKI